MRGVIGVWVVGVVGLSFGSSIHAQTTAELAETAAMVASLQNPDGGFAPAPGEPSDLRATSQAVRTLHYVAGAVPDVLACIKYIKSCQTDSGGFANTPGGEPDSKVTSMGLIAAAELKALDKSMIDGALVYFHDHAKEIEEVRLAIAAVDAAGAKSPDMTRWIDQIQSIREADGGFGEGPGQAFRAGTVGATVLRGGGALEDPEATVEVIKAGQQADGGWTEGEGPSSLPGCYRVFRALYMLKAKPDLEALRGFIARCRTDNGLYAHAPGGEADQRATYYATIMIRWIRLMNGERPIVETAGFTPLFNGENLDGWNGEASVWSVRDGMIVGAHKGIKHNEFLAFDEPFGDFVLSLSFRLVGGEGNSGVQLRSVRIPGTEMSGYQADIGESYWGSLYDESRRNKTLAPASKRALDKINEDGWNHYMIRAFGDRIVLHLNGAVSVDYREDDPKIARDGLIALQVHGGDPMEVHFKDIQIQRVPSPDTADATKPGFHLKTVSTDQGDRKYAVYVPEGHDASKTYPAILFLHGAGERGDDGVTPTQVGLGPAIIQRGGVPAIVIFPQARETWRADSADAQAALKALDDASKTYKIDPDRVTLTGLSMGGMGSWSLAAKHPDKFAAIVPVCGPGRLEDVPHYKDLPIRAFVGDADSPRLHLGMRAMIEALRDAGQNPEYTEYRGVGHNSWDRAYNDPELIDWMLSQHRK